MSQKFKILFLYPNEAFLNPPPVGIGCLSAVLKEAGFETDIFDTTFYEVDGFTSDKAKEENLQVRSFSFEERGIFADKADWAEDLRNKIKEFQPNLIALSALEVTYFLGLKMLGVVNDFKIPVVAGGVYPTASPEEIIKHPDITYVCVGEGEKAIINLADALANGKDDIKIRNIWTKRNGAIFKNDLDPPVDINALPVPDYSVFDERRFFRPMAGRVYKAVPVETNRGCPYRCTFCNSPSTLSLYSAKGIRGFFRKKTVKKIYEELKYLIRRWQAEYVYFPSDTFLLMTEKELDEFVEMYSEFKLPFWIQTRPETVNYDAMRKLKEAGCHRISIGLEHGNFEFRKNVLRKPFRDEVFVNAANILNEVGIPLTINNIIGFPYETRELIFDTIRLNRKVKFDTTNAYVFYPFTGTHLHDICKKEGYIKGTNTERGCTTIACKIEMPQLSSEEIKGLRRTFVMYVKMPESMWPEIKIAESFDEEGNKKFRQLREIYLKKYA